MIRATTPSAAARAGFDSLAQGDPLVEIGAERRLLLALVAHASDAELLACMQDASLDWERLLPIVMQEHVLVLLADRMAGQSSLANATPAGARRLLTQARLRARHRCHRFARLARIVTDAARSAGAPALLMKGAARVAWTGRPEARSLNDLDVLVPVAAFEACAAALVASGLRPRPHAANSSPRERVRYHELEFVRVDGGERFAVDLHWRLYPADRAFCIPTVDLVERSLAVEFCGVPVRTLSREDTFVHYATQIVNDGLRFHAARIGDLVALARGELDWGVVLDIAERAGASDALALTVGVVRALGVELPSDVIARTQARGRGGAFVARFVADPRVLSGARRIERWTALALVPRLYAVRPRLTYALSALSSSLGPTPMLHVLDPFPDSMGRVAGTRTRLLQVGLGIRAAAQLRDAARRGVLPESLFPKV